MRSLIGWVGLIFAVFIVWGLYVFNTPLGLQDDNQLNGPDQVITLSQVSPLPPQAEITTITLSPAVQALADKTRLEEPIDANDMSFGFNDNPQQNLGPALDANDMSFGFDDSPVQNLGPALDANDISFGFDDSPVQNLGPALDANDMSFGFDDSPQHEEGVVLDAEDMNFVYDNSPQQKVGSILDVGAQ